MEKYFVIHSNEDGEISLEVLDKKDLAKRLQPGIDSYGDPEPNDWGTYGFISEKEAEELDYSDLSYLDHERLLIIKGEVVTPKEKKTVVEWEL